MKIKADWQEYLHGLRKRQADEIFRNCKQGIFENGLELGAGDGFMSTILTRYTKKLLCTELNDRRLKTFELKRQS